MAPDLDTRTALVHYLLRLGDDSLVLGHRLSEWCGHGPTMEEDIALANTALDHVGRANALLTYAAETEDRGRTADDLAYFRDVTDYRNVQLAELPRGDFGMTTMRQFLYSAYAYLLYGALQDSTDETLAGIAAKALKETRYHLRHTSGWVIRLGDGTDESRRRVQSALDHLWRYTGELFETDAVDAVLVEQKLAPDAAALRPGWDEMVDRVLAEATLDRPDDPMRFATGGRQGRHTEHLGHLLTVMQSVPRAHPEAQW